MSENKEEGKRSGNKVLKLGHPASAMIGLDKTVSEAQRFGVQEVPDLMKIEPAKASEIGL